MHLVNSTPPMGAGGCDYQKQTGPASDHALQVARGDQRSATSSIAGAVSNLTAKSLFNIFLYKVLHCYLQLLLQQQQPGMRLYQRC